MIGLASLKPTVAGAAAAAAVTVAAPSAVVATAVVATTSPAAVAAVACPASGQPHQDSSPHRRVSTGGYTPGQVEHARTIASVAAARGLPRRAAVVATSAALVESGLRNLDYGDRDSLGLFQQRPSQGWGSPQQILQPNYAAGAFYDRLVTIDGWASLPVGQAAQRVQRSAYPRRYGSTSAAAATLVTKVWPEEAPPSGTGATHAGDTAQRARFASGGCRADAAGAADVRSQSTRLPKNFELPHEPRRAAVVSYAVEQVGKPYVWGAEGPKAFDCSGLVQTAWARAGVGLARVTTSQVDAGTPVSSLAQAAPGDLLFIPGSTGTAAAPGHVGLYIGHGLLVNAYDVDRGVILQPISAWRGDIVAIRRIPLGQHPVEEPRV